MGPDGSYTLLILYFGALGFIAFLVLRALWRFITGLSATGTARNLGRAATKLEDAYREGRGR